MSEADKPGNKAWPQSLKANNATVRCQSEYNAVRPSSQGEYSSEKELERNRDESVEDSFRKAQKGK